MSIELYPKQREALKQLSNGKILWGNVGSGKSRVAIAYFFTNECGGIIDTNDDSIPLIPMDDFGVKDLYIITTARKRDTHEWDKELAIFEMSSHQELNNKYNNIIIVDSWNNIQKYDNIQDSFFIFDEQRVVGNGSWVKSFLKIVKNNNWILLSATPGDTWMDYVPVFIANGYFKNRTEFIRKHVIYAPYLKYPKVEKYIHTDVLEKIRKDILVDMQIEHIAKKNFIDIYVNYNKDLYEKVQKEKWDIYENSPIIDKHRYCSILSKIVNSDSSRLEAVKELLHKHKKIIIWYSYDYELDILRKLKDFGYDVYEWNGHKHQLTPKDKDWVYLVQYNANEGWNCIETNAMIFFSLTYSYKTFIQSCGRIDRINTEYDNLYYYKLLTYSTIDKQIEKRFNQKKDFNEKVFFINNGEYYD